MAVPRQAHDRRAAPHRRAGGDRACRWRRPRREDRAAMIDPTAEDRSDRREPGWILGFDTATRATAVALADAGGEVLEARDDPPRGERPRHVSRLLPLCAEVLDRAGIDYQDLEPFAVRAGPGTFTGLRIGVATARALSQASAIPLVGVSTLQSLALNAMSDGP